MSNRQILGSMAEHAQVDVHALQMDYARQQANADQQYEEWVQNCDRLRYAVSVAGTSLLQERLAVLERNPPMEYARREERKSDEVAGIQ